MLTALREAYACLIWYREFSEQEHREIVATATGKFYVDYAALLLYATAEDISYFVTNLLGIESESRDYIQDPKNAKRIEKKKISSNAARVGIFLAEKYKDQEITRTLLDLHKDHSWQEAMNYRNTWVHDKPAIIKGLGIQ